MGLGIGECCCDAPSTPPECDDACCDPYPDELKIWLQWSQTDILACVCDACPSATPFQLTLTKDADPSSFPQFSAAECPGMLWSGSGCYVTDLNDGCWSDACITATYSGSFSSGCLCCSSCDPGIDGWCIRLDVEVFATFGIANVVGVDEPGLCTIILEVVISQYIGPDCDNLELCGFTRELWMVTSNGDGVCDCGLYDLSSFGSGTATCECTQSDEVFPLCGVSIPPSTPGHPEYQQIEIPC